MKDKITILRKNTNLYKKTPVKSGIGEVTAVYFIAEVSDIRKFSNYKKLIAYAGIDPSVYESGKFRGRSKITKRGNRYLRRTIFLMSQKVVRNVEAFRQYYLRRMAKDNSYKNW